MARLKRRGWEKGSASGGCMQTLAIQQRDGVLSSVSPALND